MVQGVEDASTSSLMHADCGADAGKCHTGSGITYGVNQGGAVSVEKHSLGWSLVTVVLPVDCGAAPVVVA